MTDRLDQLMAALVKSSRDLTEREAEFISHRTLEVAVEAAGIGVWKWSKKENKLEWTPAMYRLFGYTGPHDPAWTADYDGFLSRVKERDRSRVEAAVKESVNSQGSYSIAYETIFGRRIDARGSYDGTSMTGICIEMRCADCPVYERERYAHG